MNKSRRKTLSSEHSSRKSEYEAFKMNEYLQRQRKATAEEGDELNSSEFTPSQQTLFSTLLTDPEKRAKVFELLTKEGFVQNENKSLNRQLSAKKNRMQVLAQENNGSPLHGKTQFRFESPSSKLRRLELKKLNSNKRKSASSSSEDESLQEDRLPSNQILKGVVAYCEVKSGDNDRSELIKHAMQAMGAEILERLNSRSVTHVVFRDGSFKTYERARLLGARLVSVLWIEACRKRGRRAPEGRYPAFGAKAPDYNLTTICGNLHDSRRRTIHGNQDQMSIISISEDSNMSEESGVVPSSQQSKDNISNISYANIIDDQSCVSTNLAKRACDSFELKKRQHIRSPESLALRQNQKSDEGILQQQIIVGQSTREPIQINQKPVTSRKNNKMPNSRKSLATRQNRKSSEDEDNITDDKSGSDCSVGTTKRRRMSKVETKETKTTNKISKDGVVSELSVKNSNLESRSSSHSESIHLHVTTDESKNQSSTSTNTGATLKDQKSKEIDLNPPKKVTQNSKISLESQVSIRLHVSSDESKTRSSVSTTTADSIVVLADKISATENANEKTLNRTKSKRRLYDPTNYVLDEENFRWSQADICTPIELKQKYKVEIPKELKTLRTLTRKAQQYLKTKSASSKNNKNVETKISSDSDQMTEKLNRRKSLRTIPNILHESEITSIKTNKKTHTSNSSDKNTSSEENVQNELINNKRKLNPPVNKNGSASIYNKEAKKPEKTSADKSNSLDEYNEGAKINKGNTLINSRRKSMRNVKNNMTASPEKEYAEKSSSSDKYNEEAKTNKGTTLINNRRKSMRNVKNNMSVSPEKESEEKNSSLDEYNEEVKINKGKTLINNRRKSTRNVKINLCVSPEKKSAEKSSSSEEYVTPKSVITDKKGKRKSIRKKLSTTPEEILNKIETQLIKNTPSRRSIRISNITKTPKVLDIPNIPKTPKRNIKKIDENTNVSRLIDQMISKEVSERRSTFEFETDKKPLTKKLSPKKYGTIVSTRLHREQTEVLLSIVRHLGGFTCYENEVTKLTTHLVAGDPSRTVNMLRGITRGCWILRHEWLLKSAEAGKWLPEQDYELTEFSPAVKLSRTEREVFGSKHHMDVLSGKTIWISRSSSPRHSDLQELVHLAGGKVANAPRNADVVVGEHMPPSVSVCVAEAWLLECISSYKCLPYEPYILNGPVTQ